MPELAGSPRLMPQASFLPPVPSQSSSFPLSKKSVVELSSLLREYKVQVCRLFVSFPSRFQVLLLNLSILPIIEREIEDTRHHHHYETRKPDGMDGMNDDE